MKDGVIADFDVTQAMLRHFISKAIPNVASLAPGDYLCPLGGNRVEAGGDAQQTAREAYLIEGADGCLSGRLPVNGPPVA